jgi:hypothetical protein
MMKYFKDPRTACWVIPGAVIGLIGIGGFFSIPQYTQAQTRNDQNTKALARLADCYILDSGKLKAGHSYVVPGATPKQELLLADGELICDKAGMTAQITSKSAAYMRRADQALFNGEFNRLYPPDADTGAQMYRVAYESQYYRPNPSKRPTVNADKEIGWFESYEILLKKTFGVK